MEGRKCDEPGCRCHDFLPFECSLCGRMYCLEHRSRFVHSCSGLEEPGRTNNDSSSHGGANHESVRTMMHNVNHRFDEQHAENMNRAPREHYNIASSAAPDIGISGKAAERIGQLHNSSLDAARNVKQRKISNKTKEMLIKSKAIGNPNVAQEDRVYLTVHFTEQIEALSQASGGSSSQNSNLTHHTVYLYFPRRFTVGECLQNMWTNYNQLIMRSAAFRSNGALQGLRKEDIILAMGTIDTPDWWLWDRNTPIGVCLSQYEDLLVFAIPVQDAVKAQQQLQNARTARVQALQQQQQYHHQQPHQGYGSHRHPQQPSAPPHPLQHAASENVHNNNAYGFGAGAHGSHLHSNHSSSSLGASPSKFRMAGVAATMGMGSPVPPAAASGSSAPYSLHQPPAPSHPPPGHGDHHHHPPSHPPPGHGDHHHHHYNRQHPPQVSEAGRTAAAAVAAALHQPHQPQQQSQPSSTTAMDLLNKADYQKGQLAWYHRIPKSDLEQMPGGITLARIEQLLPMVLVKIAGVHHDDYPNIYYTIQQVEPLKATNVDGAVNVGFVHEKQTDKYHLFPLATPPSPPPAAAAAGATPAAGHNATNGSSTRGQQFNNGDAAVRATQDLLESLSKMGPPMTIKAVHGKRDGGKITIGSDCTIAQLKMLMGAIFEIPVPNIRLISKGHTFNNNNQKLRDSKLTNGSKVVVMGSPMVV